MRAKERTYLANRQWNPLLRLLPREHAQFGFRRKHRGFDGHGIRMSRNVVGQNQNRRLTVPDEIARHLLLPDGEGTGQARRAGLSAFALPAGPAPAGWPPGTPGQVDRGRLAGAAQKNWILPFFHWLESVPALD